MLIDWSIDDSVSVLTATFQVNLGQPLFIEAKDDGSGGDNWSYKPSKAPVKSPPPTNQHPVSGADKARDAFRGQSRSNIVTFHMSGIFLLVQ